MRVPCCFTGCGYPLCAKRCPLWCRSRANSNPEAPAGAEQRRRWCTHSLRLVRCALTSNFHCMLWRPVPSFGGLAFEGGIPHSDRYIFALGMNVVQLVLWMKQKYYARQAFSNIPSLCRASYCRRIFVRTSSICSISLRIHHVNAI